MPSDETRRLLKTLGVAVTAYEDAVHDKAAMDAILQSEEEARARLEDVTALIDRLRTTARPTDRVEN
jgi:hypothetical protein